MSKPGFSNAILALLAAIVIIGGLDYVIRTFEPPHNAALAKEAHHEHAPGEEHTEDEAHDDAGHEEHDAHDEHEGEGNVHLSPERLAELDITLSPVHRGSVKSTLSFPAEIMLDPDGEAHLVPRVAGIAREILVSIGEEVKQGDVLAVLESRELGGAKSDYLAQLAYLDLARTTFNREKRLWEEKICSEQDYLEARQAFQAAQIAVESSQQALYALGLSSEDVSGLPREVKTDLTRFEIRAPFDGTVIARHISRGEAVSGERSIFLLAELDTVWAMGRVTERDIRKIAPGQEAIVQLEGFPGEEFVGTIDYIGSILDPSSRTVDARVIVPNAEKRIRAGMFGRLAIFLDSHEHDETMLVPNGALQRTATGAIVYRMEGTDEFEPVPVEILHASDTFTEVQGNLEENDRVAVGDIFVLKSEAGKAAMGGGHSH